MCLYVSKKRKNPTKDFKIYKVFKTDCTGRIITPSTCHEVKEGIFKASGKLYKKNFKTNDMIEGGAIHAYQTEKAAKESNWGNGTFIVEFIAKPKDFIAWGQRGDVTLKCINIPVGTFEKQKNVAKFKNLRDRLQNTIDKNNQLTRDLIICTTALAGLKTELANLIQ